MAVHHFFSSAQAAKILGISRISVYKRIKKGQIKAVRIGRNFAIAEDTLSEMLTDKSEHSANNKDKEKGGNHVEESRNYHGDM